MEFTQFDVMLCYVWARDFYKNKAKSLNKVYDAEVNPERQERRLKAIQAGANQGLARDYRGDGWSYLNLGNHIRHEDLQLGNCWEMSSVVVSFIHQNIPDAPMMLGHLLPPADHMFVIVGDSSLEGMSVEHLSAFQPSGQSYIVDAWAGICCRTQDYCSRFTAKMKKWDELGKRILAEDEDYQEYLVRPFGEYTETQIKVPILLSDPYDPM